MQSLVGAGAVMGATTADFSNVGLGPFDLQVIAWLFQ